MRNFILIKKIIDIIIYKAIYYPKIISHNIIQKIYLKGYIHDSTMKLMHWIYLAKVANIYIYINEK